MAETSSPQFVIAHSVTSTVSGIVSLIIAVVLVEAEIRIAMQEGIFDQTYSSYKQSTRGILLSQTIGVVVGAIAPTSRWFVAINHRNSTDCKKNMENALKVEDYWTQKLVEWQRSPLSVKIEHLKCRKALHDLRRLILKLCVSVQNLIVLSSKLVLAISICITRPIKSSLDCIRGSRQKQILDSGSDSDVDIRRYVIQLEGEVELPAKTLENIFKEEAEIIKKGKTRKPKNLLNLLLRSSDFKGETEFDSPHVLTLHPQELPYCWSLPIVTLACIAMAIPHIPKEKFECLLRSVIEGLRYVKFIDKLLDRKGESAKARAAAIAVSIQAEFNGKRQNKNLGEISIKGKNAEETLRKLLQDSERTVLEFNRNPKNHLMQNGVYWPHEVIEANSMYRVSKTILLHNGGGTNDKTDEQFFEMLSVMIANLLAACLTNLPHAITIKCHCNDIEKRERGVRKAAKYLGETEDIIALLQQRELPSLAPDQAAHIEERRALIGPDLSSHLSSSLVRRSSISTFELAGFIEIRRSWNAISH